MVRWPVSIYRARTGRGPGQAMVEFALILPVFILMVMGVLQIALLCMVWFSLQGLAEDTVRWMSISSPSNLPAANCALTVASNWPRPHWADGLDGGANYMKCTARGTMLDPNRIQSAVWNPACAPGADCYAAADRAVDGRLTLTLTYDWSNVLIMPIISGGGILAPLSFPTTVTVTAAAVMQY